MVIVPAYNEVDLIKTTLQTMPYYVDQIVTINDCSTDNTLDIMKECARTRFQDSRNKS